MTGGKFCGSNADGDRCPLVATGCQLADLVDYVVSAVPPTGFRAVLEADALARETSRTVAAQTLAGPSPRISKRRLRKVLMRVTYDGPDFGLGKLNNKRAFACCAVLADLGLLKVDEDTGMGWAELSIAVEELLVLVPQARGKYPQGPGL